MSHHHTLSCRKTHNPCGLGRHAKRYTITVAVACKRPHKCCRCCAMNTQHLTTPQPHTTATNHSSTVQPQTTARHHSHTCGASPGHDSTITPGVSAPCQHPTVPVPADNGSFAEHAAPVAAADCHSVALGPQRSHHPSIHTILLRGSSSRAHTHTHHATHQGTWQDVRLTRWTLPHTHAACS
jgi:hypothetical protein